MRLRHWGVVHYILSKQGTENTKQKPFNMIAVTAVVSICAKNDGSWGVHTVHYVIDIIFAWPRFPASNICDVDLDLVPLRWA